MAKTHEKATFAGGCFWCMVSPFDEREGIIEVVSGSHILAMYFRMARYLLNFVTA